MNGGKNEQEFLRFAKKHLDESVENLDAATLSRLARARQKAYSSESHGIQWAWPAWGLATASVIVLSIILWVQNPMNSDPNLVTEDLELLASSDSLEFYDDLEFYDWLAEYDQAS